MNSPYDANGQIADHLASTLPIHTLAHLTHAGRPVSRLEHDAAFDSFMRKLQEATHTTIGYLRGPECDPVPHSHVALVSARTIPINTIETAWKEASGAAGCLAEPFDQSRAREGLCYVLKAGEYEYSRNIHLFSSTTTADNLSGRELRTFHRIQDQHEVR